MTIDNYEKAKALMVQREKYQNHAKALRNDVLPLLNQGRIKFEKSGYQPVDIQAPLSLSQEFIKKVEEYYQEKVSKIDLEFESL